MRAKTTEDRKLLEILDPVAQTLGLEIVRLRLMGGGRPGASRRLQIMAERPEDGDITVNQCARLSRAVSEILDASDPIEGEYILEVSSPGIDRPLTRLKDFETYEGYEARLELDRLVENRKRFKGLLAGIEDDHVAIDLEGEEDTALVPFAWIVEAKLVLNDALMERGAAMRAARLEAGLDDDDDDADPEGASLDGDDADHLSFDDDFEFDPDADHDEQEEDPR
ncbi:MAG: ribosome maturation factor RimP [Asticcacaulis sp.]